MPWVLSVASAGWVPFKTLIAHRPRISDSEDLRGIEETLDHAFISEGVPIAPVEAIVIMKLIAGRTQDLADVEAIIASGIDRDFVRSVVQKAAPNRAEILEKLFGNVDRMR